MLPSLSAGCSLLRLLVGAFAFSLVFHPDGHAATLYPNHPIRLVVPFAAGGGTDLFGRVVAEKLTKILGESVIVENRTGAGGNIGAGFVAKAAPDGYTLLVGHTGTLAINPNLYAKIPYDPLRDFSPISVIGVSALVLVVPPTLPAQSLKGLIALAKKSPGKLFFASGGIGTGEHLSAELFKSMAKINIVHVPYNGTAPAISALLGGQQAQMYIGVLPPLVPLVKAGRLRALAVTSAKRSDVLPDVPTMSEAGVPGYESILTFGVLAPTGTSQAVIGKLNSAIVQGMGEPDVKKSLAAVGAEPMTTTPEKFHVLIQEEIKKWGAVISDAGIPKE